MRVSAVLVSYRSGPLARRAIESLREVSPGPVEVVVVVNSGESAEADLVASVADRVLVAERNLGFAGGLNRGLTIATGDVLLLANPDLVFREGSVAALVERASAGRVMAGPVFHWDDVGSILLPPAEEPHPRAFLRRSLSATGAGREAVFRRGLRQARAQADAAEGGRDVERTALSGALMAVSRATLEAVGPFDEAYPLYYEENDWQSRLRAGGGRLVQAGAARVVHRYNQSARSEPRAAAWFAESERRYVASRFGARGERALGFAATGPAAPVPEPLPDGVLRWTGSARVSIAVSPLPSFHPFAFAPAVAGIGWRLPADVAEGLSGTWYVRAVDASSGLVLAQGALLDHPRV